MNLLLLPAESLDGQRLRVTDTRRLAHLRDVHRLVPGQSLTVGVENGLMGRARLVSLTPELADFELEHLTQKAPPPLPIHVVLALPRPRMLARSLENMAALGVKHITLLHTRRVEKSYWQSPELDPLKIRHHMVLGLEQARDTTMPKVHLAQRFKPFVEDELPGLMTGREGLVAHPGEMQSCPPPRALDAPPLLLAIGPEGGFIEYEMDALKAAGLKGIHMGERILRVETAVVALLSRLFKPI
ncbi:16S rRNA (uracil(1498)-N(3))-methyltransferase [Larsenimonas rhizosphaerae]|uniref:16S rRNA (uracil(1498)-N(3))-methyltransferase n=1 Tax=Larsenimonas rhizosphaerae TaxID=2944682 RepID=UPI00203363CA|nr:16S rRNA (uracil(1498)-N(3))-methyltransferase [Larsenimonas rhizosphaerae]MCM2130170.1 16S rRNA (uracil(1498)-N(3))-methyltransferase [Larsenimonas rhizosphaerae]